MSSITTEQGILHYEVFGRGRPVILLHGWLGSWGLWQETMAQLGQHFRTYALDFWGFGESGKKRETFTVQDFVAMVDQFMEQLGIERAPLVGHSMGGTVSLMVAIRYPQRVEKVVVVGSPIVGSSLSFLLKLFGQPWVAYIVHHNLWMLRLGFRILAPLYSRDPRWSDMMNRDLSRTTLESFLISISSLRRTDLRPELNRVLIPAMPILRTMEPLGLAESQNDPRESLEILMLDRSESSDCKYQLRHAASGEPMDVNRRTP